MKKNLKKEQNKVNQIKRVQKTNKNPNSVFEEKDILNLSRKMSGIYVSSNDNDSQSKIYPDINTNKKKRQRSFDKFYKMSEK
jgi:hypothetical protein